MGCALTLSQQRCILLDDTSTTPLAVAKQQSDYLSTVYIDSQALPRPAAVVGHVRNLSQ